jgi:hypothetical protein
MIRLCDKRVGELSVGGRKGLDKSERTFLLSADPGLGRRSTHEELR